MNIKETVRTKANRGNKNGKSKISKIMGMYA